MAQLGIRDKNYRPNQYLNPMLIGMKHEPNMEDARYRIFDKSNPEHPDYDKDDDEGDVQLELPLAQQMQINSQVANITPRDFSPPRFRYIPHIRIPEIKRQEMEHMKNFIEAMGGDTKGLVRRNLRMTIYGS